MTKRATILYYLAIKLAKDRYKKGSENGVPSQHHLRPRRHEQDRKPGRTLEGGRTTKELWCFSDKEFRLQEMTINSTPHLALSSAQAAFYLCGLKR